MEQLSGHSVATYAGVAYAGLVAVHAVLYM